MSPTLPLEPALAQVRQEVVLGIDTHRDQNTAAVVALDGRLCGNRGFPTTAQAAPTCWPGPERWVRSGWSAPVPTVPRCLGFCSPTGSRCWRSTSPTNASAAPKERPTRSTPRPRPALSFPDEPRP